MDRLCLCSSTSSKLCLMDSPMHRSLDACRPPFWNDPFLISFFNHPGKLGNADEKKKSPPLFSFDLKALNTKFRQEVSRFRGNKDLACRSISVEEYPDTIFLILWQMTEDVTTHRRRRVRK